jgi:hypothetical protein
MRLIFFNLYLNLNLNVISYHDCDYYYYIMYIICFR